MLINKIKVISHSLFLLFLVSCTTKVQKEIVVTPNLQPVVAIPHLEVKKLIITPDPDGHRDFINAILTAKKSVYLKMFHLTNDDIVEALIKAKLKGTDIKVILDGKSMVLSRFSDPYKKLLDNNVPVVKSSKKFTITHEKSMTIDHETAFVTAINLTKNYKTTRDFGVITSDSQVVNDMENVFLADWQNAEKNTKNTPAIKSPFLVYSPVNSEDRLVGLIQSAKTTIDLEVENLGDEEIQDALIAAAQKNIVIRVIVPLCDKNFNPFHNVKYIEDMQKKNIQTRVMPSPATEKAPYMHSKMILVDGESIYLGSINFSNNSVKKARELGLIFSNQDVANQISNEYQKDWQQAIPLPEKRSRIQCVRDMRGTL